MQAAANAASYSENEVRASEIITKMVGANLPYPPPNIKGGCVPYAATILLGYHVQLSSDTNFIPSYYKGSSANMTAFYTKMHEIMQTDADGGTASDQTKPGLESYIAQYAPQTHTSVQNLIVGAGETKATLASKIAGQINKDQPVMIGIDRHVLVAYRYTYTNSVYTFFCHDGGSEYINCLLYTSFSPPSCWCCFGPFRWFSSMIFINRSKFAKFGRRPPTLRSISMIRTQAPLSPTRPRIARYASWLPPLAGRPPIPRMFYRTVLCKLVENREQRIEHRGIGRGVPDAAGLQGYCRACHWR